MSTVTDLKNDCVMELARHIGKEWRPFLVSEFLPRCVPLVQQDSKKVFELFKAQKICQSVIDATLWVHDASHDFIVKTLLNRWDCLQDLPLPCLLLAKYLTNKHDAGETVDQLPSLNDLQQHLLAA